METSVASRRRRRRCRWRLRDKVWRASLSGNISGVLGAREPGEDWTTARRSAEQTQWWRLESAAMRASRPRRHSARSTPLPLHLRCRQIDSSSPCLLGLHAAPTNHPPSRGLPNISPARQRARRRTSEPVRTRQHIPQRHSIQLGQKTFSVSAAIAPDMICCNSCARSEHWQFERTRPQVATGPLHSDTYYVSSLAPAAAWGSACCRPASSGHFQGAREADQLLA